MRATALCFMAAGLALASGVAHAGNDKEGVAAVDAAWVKAVKRGDLDAVMKCYRKDAVLWIGGAPMASGEAAIRATYQNWFAGTTILDASLNELGHRTHDDHSVAWGTYTMTTQAKSGGKPVKTTGRYSEVADQVHGHWEYAMDHADDDPSLPRGK